MAATDETLDCSVPPGVISVVCELLDAHGDTARLAGNLTSGSVWMEHPDHMQRLQRIGREALAHARDMA